MTSPLAHSVKRLVPLVAVFAMLVFAASAAANGNLVFSAGPGTNAPETTLGPYKMTPFATDPTTDGTELTSFNGPTGPIGVSLPLTKGTVPTTWNNWSNGYTGSVYFSANHTRVTITLPAGTAAVYFYAESDDFGTSTDTVTAQDGVAADTTTGSASVTSPSGASYFGFYATGGKSIWKLTLENTSSPETEGVGIGELGIAALPPPPLATTGAASAITTTTAQLAGTVNPESLATTSFFEYGASTNYGQVSPTPPADAGNGSTEVSAAAALTGLAPSTTYHYRVVAVNLFGQTADGADATFTTSAAPPPPPPVVKHCVVPKLTHLSLSAAKSALSKAGCKLGKVKTGKRPAHTKGLAEGVLSVSPAAGTTVLATAPVNLSVGWFKKPHHKKKKK